MHTKHIHIPFFGMILKIKYFCHISVILFFAVFFLGLGLVIFFGCPFSWPPQQHARKRELRFFAFICVFFSPPQGKLTIFFAFKRNFSFSTQKVYKIHIFSVSFQKLKIAIFMLRSRFSEEKEANLRLFAFICVYLRFFCVVFFEGSGCVSRHALPVAQLVFFSS